MAKRSLCEDLPEKKRCKIERSKEPPADFLLETDAILRRKEVYGYILRQWYKSTDYPELPDTVYEEILSFTPHRDHRPEDLYDMTAAEFGLKSFAESKIVWQKKIIFCYKILMEFISTKAGFYELVHNYYTQDSLKYTLRKPFKQDSNDDRKLLKQVRDKIILENQNLHLEIQEMIKDRSIHWEHSPYNAYQCTAFLLSINFYESFKMQCNDIPIVQIPSYRRNKIDDFLEHRLGVFLVPKTYREQGFPDVLQGYPRTPSIDFMKRPLSWRAPRIQYDYVDSVYRKWWKEAFVLYWPRYRQSGDDSCGQYHQFFSHIQRFEYGLRASGQPNCDVCKKFSMSDWMHLAVDDPSDPNEGEQKTLLVISGTRLDYNKEPHDLSMSMLGLVLDGGYLKRPVLLVSASNKNKEPVLRFLKEHIEKNEWWKTICDMRFQDVTLCCPQIDAVDGLADKLFGTLHISPVFRHVHK